MNVSILHPKKTMISRIAMSDIIASNDFLCQKKYDGCLARRTVAGATLLGELVTARSGAFLTPKDKALIERHGSFFAAFTVEAVHGENVLNKSTRERRGILCGYTAYFPPDMILCEQIYDVDAVMASGAEGVVAHAWGDSWGNMLCHKIEQIYVCRVTRTGSTQSVGICDAATGADRGNLKMGGGACDKVRAGKDGSIIRVAGMGLTDAGKIRQPTLCRDWLLKF